MREMHKGCKTADEQPNRLCQLNDFEQVQKQRAKKSGDNPAKGEEQLARILPSRRLHTFTKPISRKQSPKKHVPNGIAHSPAKSGKSKEQDEQERANLQL